MNIAIGFFAIIGFLFIVGVIMLLTMAVMSIYIDKYKEMLDLKRRATNGNDNQ